MSTFWVLSGGDLAAFSTALTVSEICCEIPSLLNPSEFSWFVPYQNQPPHLQHRDMGLPQLLRKKRGVQESAIG